MLFVEQGPDLNMCSCVDYALFLGSLKNVVNVQVPSDFDVGASEHGAQLENIRAEALHVIPLYKLTTKNR